MKFLPSVVRAEYVDNYRIQLTFNASVRVGPTDGGSPAAATPLKIKKTLWPPSGAATCYAPVKTTADGPGRRAASSELKLDRLAPFRNGCEHDPSCSRHDPGCRII